MNPYLDSLILENPKHVFIDESKLKEIAKKFAKEDFKVPNWRTPVFFQQDSREFIDFLGVGNSINFCFRDLKTKKRFCTKYKCQDWEGAFGMWASLKRALEEGISVLDPTFLATLDLDTARHIFRGDPPLSMMEERVTCLRETGKSLLKNYESFYDLFRKSEWRAFNIAGRGIVERLADEFYSYDDLSIHPTNRKPMYFYKRANLLVLMYQGRALSSFGALPLVRDVSCLTPPADYEVPKSLKYLGILRYDILLEEQIRKQQPIPKDDICVIEIRSQMVKAVCQLIDEVNKLRDEPISIVEMDYKLWSEGRDSPEPHHLTETTAY